MIISYSQISVRNPIKRWTNVQVAVRGEMSLDEASNSFSWFKACFSLSLLFDLKFGFLNARLSKYLMLSPVVVSSCSSNSSLLSSSLSLRMADLRRFKRRRGRGGMRIHNTAAYMYFPLKYMIPCCPFYQQQQRLLCDPSIKTWQKKNNTIMLSDPPPSLRQLSIPSTTPHNLSQMTARLSVWVKIVDFVWDKIISWQNPIYSLSFLSLFLLSCKRRINFVRFRE